MRDHKAKGRQNDPELLKACAATVVFIKTYYYGRSEFQHPFHCKDTVPVPTPQYPRQPWT